MREIKFRGKTGGGVWYYGYLVNADGFSHIFFGWEVNGGWKFVEVTQETVGQFTGLKDKNGVEIYEGDVVDTVNIHGELSGYPKIVEFKEQNLGHSYHQQTIGWNVRSARSARGARGSDCGLSALFGNPSVEVIGNIHENPELLEIKND